MLSVSDALDRLHTALAAAKASGADAADAVYVGDLSTGIQVRLGKLEDVARSEGEEIGVRLFFGTRSASVSTSDLSPAALAASVERAAAMAREAPEDPYAGLAPADMLMRAAPGDFDLDDGGASATPDRLKEMALAAEDAARAVPGVTNSEGGSASIGRGTVAIATSHGFSGGYTGTSYGASASVIAGNGTGMQRDYAYRQARHLADLEAPEAIGRRAGERAVRRLNPTKLSSGAMPVVFDPRVGASFLGHLIGAITGSAIARKTSFLLDARGKPVFGKGIVIRDDPHRHRGLRSKPFDGEGLPTAPQAIIDDGVLTGWLIGFRIRPPAWRTADGTCQPGYQRPAGRGLHQSLHGSRRAFTRRADGRHRARPVCCGTDRSWRQSGDRRLQPGRRRLPDRKWKIGAAGCGNHHRGQSKGHVP